MQSLLENRAILSISMVLLGIFLTHLLWMWRWRLAKKQRQEEITDNRKRENDTRFLEGLGNEYTSYNLAIQEIWHYAWTDNKTYKQYRDQAYIDGQARIIKKALKEMEIKSPNPIFETADNAFNLVLQTIKNKDSLPSATEDVFFAYIRDFEALIKTHLCGEKVVPLKDDESMVARIVYANEELIESMRKDLQESQSE